VLVLRLAVLRLLQVVAAVAVTTLHSYRQGGLVATVVAGTDQILRQVVQRVAYQMLEEIQAVTA
jgi:hypothetical protein